MILRPPFLEVAPSTGGDVQGKRKIYKRGTSWRFFSSCKLTKMASPYSVGGLPDHTE